MNIHVTEMTETPSRAELETALARLKAWMASATPEEIAALDPSVARLAAPAYPVFERRYPADFTVDAAYKAGLPDLQNGPSSLIKGANRQIQHVGISNFRLPIRFRNRGDFCFIDNRCCALVGSFNDRGCFSLRL